ncbi:MAG TPA: TetR family transcriptional regulator C-terminal domain-containing protein [Rhodopila sp.]|uniref:TetR/AcrR family transcriptional regulator n=1 Tax=Rhodopila sp. TaxID=2480087 RepID=UPI002CC4AC0E|nr:TetR family transcriptional regulator C-terminal domain-containing protein [Rhodopila sp.]HVY13802.1 TetR family transcriptional regulator C-terminal domain-containing protein [Rhodopila sp.]
MRRPSTRDQLLATGLKVLHARGFHATGVQDIAEAADVPKASFYSHFPSKEAFGADVLGRYWERRASHAAAILGDETRPPMDRLRTYFEGKTSPPPDAPFDKGCMIGNFSAELAGSSRLVRDRLATVFAAWGTLLARCIRDAQADGTLRPDLDPDETAAFLIDAFEGAVLRTKVDRDGAALARFRSVVFSLILV